MSTQSVIVGMSGGVDSSVAAALLVEAGYAVRGLFMKNWEEDDGTEFCTAQEDLADAQRVADKLGIELLTANFAAEYWDNVFAAFLRDYAANRTPNPDVLCNREIKFHQFARYAKTLGADGIATGHYARLEHRDGVPILRKGVDSDKDQTYFLQAVALEQFESVLFPLGELHKTEVRARAHAMGLHNARKKDSTGICFIGERRFDEFLKNYVPPNPGPIVDTHGRQLGVHQGLQYFTIGQRQGLGIGGRRDAKTAPWYVARKDALNNHLVVSQVEEDLEADWLAASDPNWLMPEVELPLVCTAKTRYRQQDQAAYVTRRADGGLLVRFDNAQRAVTPGQYVALYLGDRLVGGAVIDHAGRSHRCAA